jgi:hypothetical protein
MADALDRIPKPSLPAENPAERPLEHSTGHAQANIAHETEGDRDLPGGRKI